MPGVKSFLKVVLCNFVLAKLATSSQRVKVLYCWIAVIKVPAFK